MRLGLVCANACRNVAPHWISFGFIAANPAPKAALSTVACHFVYQIMQAILIKKQNPV